MDNRNHKTNSGSPRTAEIQSPMKKYQNEKKMPSFHHPTTNPPKK